MLHKSHYGYNKQGYQKNKQNDWLDTLATKIAEVRLSELGYRFIPGIAPYFTRAKKFIEAKAMIVKSEGLISNEGNQERKTQ
jgi:hypothetical protein